MHPNLSIFALFWQADILVKAIMLSLIMASVFSWRVIIKKMLIIRNFKAEVKAVENGAVKNNAGSFGISRAIDSFLAKVKKEKEFGRSLSVADISSLIEIEARLVLVKIEAGLDILATIASASPFVGLFGTVWGIMHSFQTIGKLKSVALTVVAPSIGEALLATAVGLFVAIPALIFYNYLSSRINKLSTVVQSLMYRAVYES